MSAANHDGVKARCANQPELPRLSCLADPNATLPYPSFFVPSVPPWLTLLLLPLAPLDSMGGKIMMIRHEPCVAPHYRDRAAFALGGARADRVIGAALEPGRDLCQGTRL